MFSENQRICEICGKDATSNLCGHFLCKSCIKVANSKNFDLYNDEFFNKLFLEINGYNLDEQYENNYEPQENLFVNEDVEKVKEEAEELKEEAEELKEEAELSEKRKALSEMLITSGFHFEGYRIIKYSGYISGDDAISVDRGVAGILINTATNVQSKLMDSLVIIRRNALRELKEAAYNLGCNAVIGVDFDYINLDPQTANWNGGTTYLPYIFGVTANGNAVIIEKIEDSD